MRILVILLAFFIISCDQQKPDERESYKYNAYFEMKDGGKVNRMYVGTVTGLSSCKYIVSTFYAKRRAHVKGHWDYVCCRQGESKACVSEDRY